MILKKSPMRRNPKGYITDDVGHLIRQWEREDDMLQVCCLYSGVWDMEISVDAAG